MGARGRRCRKLGWEVGRRVVDGRYGHHKESGYSPGGFRRRCGVAGVASDHEWAGGSLIFVLFRSQFSCVSSLWSLALSLGYDEFVMWGSSTWAPAVGEDCARGDGCAHTQPTPVLPSHPWNFSFHGYCRRRCRRSGLSSRRLEGATVSRHL